MYSDGILLCLVVVDAVNKVLYTARQDADVRLPEGWKHVKVNEYSQSIKMAINIRNCGWMSGDQKIRGIKMIRCAINNIGNGDCQLVEAKEAWEYINAMSGDAFQCLSQAA